jgi:hypothetical protein
MRQDAIHRKLGGRQLEGDPGLAEDAVLAGVGERGRAAVHLGHGQLAAHRAAQAADLEDVGEVGAEGELDGEVDRGLVVAADADALVQAAVDHPGTADVDGALQGDDLAVAFRVEVLVGDVDVAHVGTVGRGRQQQGVAAVHPHDQVREEAAVPVVQAGADALLRHQVPLRVREQEHVAFLGGPELLGAGTQHGRDALDQDAVDRLVGQDELLTLWRGHLVDHGARSGDARVRRTRRAVDPASAPACSA